MARLLEVFPVSCHPFWVPWDWHELVIPQDSPWLPPWPIDATPVQDRTDSASVVLVDPWCWFHDAAATCANAKSSLTWLRCHRERNDSQDRSCAYLPDGCATCGQIDRSYRISGRDVDLWRGPASCPNRGERLKKEDKQKADEVEFPEWKSSVVSFSFLSLFFFFFSLLPRNLQLRVAQAPGN